MVALAQRIVAVEVKGGGTIDGLCRAAMQRGRRVFACQFAERPIAASANDSLIAAGAAPLVADSAGSNVDLVLAAAEQRPSARLFETDDLERRRALGQFFTPSEVAQFIWEMVDVLRGRKWNRTARVIDPACGEGVFVRAAIERGQSAENCFGADIDETLVPVWGSDAQLRVARLFRTNGLMDNPSIGLVPGSFDLVIGNPPFSGTGLKDLLRLVQPPAGKSSQRARRLFGDEPDETSAKKPAADSMPIARHERAILDYLARQLSRYTCWRLREESDDGTEAAIETAGGAGGLFANLDLGADRPVRASDYERMAQAVAAWPSDRLMDTTQPEVRDMIRRLASTAIEVFFTERFVQLAKPGGMIAVIVPESILASDQLGPLRRWLMQQVQLLAVVGLPQKLFTGVGANARTGIIFARRFTDAELQANAKGEEFRPGCRLSQEMLSSEVLMSSPDPTHPEWSLDGYFGGIVQRLRKLSAGRGAKTS